MDDVILSLDNVSMSYGGLSVLEGTSFDVPRGQITGLIGPNGAGKSTLFELISGFHRPTGGRILFEGVSLVGMRPHEVTRMGIARSFQHLELLHSCTVFDTILLPILPRLPLRSAKEEAAEVIEGLGLVRLAKTSIASLSYSVQKLVELGRVLAARPRLVLLDELLAGIDDEEVEGILAVIDRVKREGGTILMIEHNLAKIRQLCDQVVMLNFGRIVAKGTFEEIAANPAVVEAYMRGWQCLSYKT